MAGPLKKRRRRRVPEDGYPSDLIIGPEFENDMME